MNYKIGCLLTALKVKKIMSNSDQKKKPLKGKERLYFILATGFGLGLSPIMPGTCGALLGLAAHLILIFILPAHTSVQIIAWTLAALCLIASLLCLALNDWAAKHFQDSDSGNFILDEIAGYLAAALLTPAAYKDIPTAIYCFIAFRILDMIKIFPADLVDRRMKNRFGVLLDDLISAVYAAIIVNSL